MIFTGDIACPNLESLPKLNIPDSLAHKKWVGNLEGAIELSENSLSLIKTYSVFNNIASIKKIKEHINIKAFGLANNHITDTNTIENTQHYLNDLNIQYSGAGKNLNDSKKPIVLFDEQEVVILNFGWRSISCKEASDKKQGVNPYNKNNIVKQVREILKKKSTSKIIAYFHWNYELELYPQPFDRDLSYHLIDLGVSAVIGCHAHRVQGSEMYKGKPIIYGLGNFIFPQNSFWSRNLKFPSFCDLQLCFEIDFKANRYICHWFQYDKNQNEINYINSESLSESVKLKELSPFRNLSSKEYAKWFKINRYHKKLLPIFKYSDKEFVLNLKHYWIQLRHFLIMNIVKIKNL